jgi:hypothetical protein
VGDKTTLYCFFLLHFPEKIGEREPRSNLNWENDGHWAPTSPIYELILTFNVKKCGKQEAQRFSKKILPSLLLFFCVHCYFCVHTIVIICGEHSSY